VTEQNLFGTHGVRGIVNKDLTIEVVFNLSRAIGTFLNGGQVVTGYDGRISSSAFQSVTMGGLASTGCDVCDAGQVPTPMVNFLTRDLKAKGGVIITASHNPPEYNGVKFISAGGIDGSEKEAREIERIYSAHSWKNRSWRQMGNVTKNTTGTRKYFDSIKKCVSVASVQSRHLTVAVDPGNGVSVLTTPPLLSELDCRVLTINANIDGTFPGRPSEPRPNTLGGLSKFVVASKADFGVALDGDGDRAVFVDEKGKAHWGDKTFALIIEDYLSTRPGATIVTPISSSKLIKDIIDARNGKIVWTKIGSVSISQGMLKTGSELGGEDNGGVLYGPHMITRDGTMTTALIANIITKTKQSLSTLMAALPAYHIIKDSVPCPNSLKKRVLDLLRERTRKYNPETIDGVKIWFKDESSILMRPSGTEPIFRIFTEAKFAHTAKKLADQYRAMVAEEVKSTG